MRTKKNEKAIMSVYKKHINRKREKREALKCGYINPYTGTQCIMNNFFAVELYEPYREIPNVPADLSYPDFDRLTPRGYLEESQKFNLKELKYQAWKEHGTKEHLAYLKFDGNTELIVNYDYLEAIVKCLDNMENFTIKYREGDDRMPVLIENENGRGLLMPVKSFDNLKNMANGGLYGQSVEDFDAAYNNYYKEVAGDQNNIFNTALKLNDFNTCLEKGKKLELIHPVLEELNKWKSYSYIYHDIFENDNRIVALYLTLKFFGALYV